MSAVVVRVPIKSFKSHGFNSTKLSWHIANTGQFCLVVQKLRLEEE